MKFLSLTSRISTKKTCNPIVLANWFSQSAFYLYTSKEASKPQLFDFRKSEPKAASAAKPFTTVNSAVPEKTAALNKPDVSTKTTGPIAPSESVANTEQVESKAPRSNLEEIQTFLNTNDFASSGDEWSRSFFGVGSQAFSKEIADILLAPINIPDIEIKQDGLIYLPEIKYRRILNKAFGPGGWGLVPRGPTSVTAKNLSREYALICQGRFVSQARGEQDYFDKEDISVAAEGAKSNALTRCCKDLGIASELWDPSFVRKFKEEHCEQTFAQHVTTGRKRVIWRIKGNPLEGPYKL